MPQVTTYILDKKARDHEFQPKFSSQIWYDNDFFYFYISEDSFGHHLSQIWHFYLLQQQSWAVLSMTAPSNEMFQNLYSKTHAFSFNASIVFLFTFYEKCISFL